MNKSWEYHNFKTDHRNRTEQFYCGQNVTNDEGETVLLEAMMCLGADQVKLESEWTQEEIDALLTNIETNIFTDQFIEDRFSAEKEDQGN